METTPEQKDETDHTLWEFVKMWASLIMLSIESFWPYPENEQNRDTVKCDTQKETKVNK